MLLAKGGYSKAELAEKFGLENKMLLKIIDIMASRDEEYKFSGIMKIFDDNHHPLKILFAMKAFLKGKNFSFRVKAKDRAAAANDNQFKNGMKTMSI